MVTKNQNNPPYEDEHIEKHSVTLSGHRTSISLEHLFWHKLKEIAVTKNTTLQSLIESIDKDRHTNLSSALRVFIFRYFIKKD